MKKILATLSAALMMVAFLGVTQATAEPGPNGSNDKGLCTAFFNGQKAGLDKDGDGFTDSARPFQALETVAGAAAEMLPEEVAAFVYQFCLTLAGQGGDGVEIGGNPDDNGRWTCTDGSETEDTADDGTYTCEPNEPKGNGNGPPAPTA